MHISRRVYCNHQNYCIKNHHTIFLLLHSISLMLVNLVPEFVIMHETQFSRGFGFSGHSWRKSDNLTFRFSFSIVFLLDKWRKIQNNLFIYLLTALVGIWKVWKFFDHKLFLCASVKYRESLFYAWLNFEPEIWIALLIEKILFSPAIDNWYRDWVTGITLLYRDLYYVTRFDVLPLAVDAILLLFSILLDYLYWGILDHGKMLLFGLENFPILWILKHHFSYVDQC